MKNIKKFRAMKNMNQTQLAEKLGISRTWLCKLESDDYKDIDREEVSKLCEIFNCNPLELYGMENFIFKPQSNKDIALMIRCLSNLLSNKEYIQELNDIADKIDEGLSYAQKESLSSLIKRIRVERNKTLKEFADEIGISFVELKNIEERKNMPRAKTIEKISKVININVDDLLSREL